MIDDLSHALMTTFLEEAQELLDDLEGALLEMENDPDDPELVDRAFRSLHTIKGNAAMMEYTDVERLAHHLESVFDPIRKKKRVVTRDLIDLALTAKDIIVELLRQPLT